jgi:two-component system cell cycle response regulator
MDSALRSYDSVGRYGGEEFIVLIPGCNGAGAAELAERLRASIADPPVQTDEGQFHCTMSFGATAVGGRQNFDLNTLIKEADEALLSAKSSGRNRVELWTAAVAGTNVNGEG